MSTQGWSFPQILRGHREGNGFLFCSASQGTRDFQTVSVLPGKAAPQQRGPVRSHSGCTLALAAGYARPRRAPHSAPRPPAHETPGKHDSPPFSRAGQAQPTPHARHLPRDRGGQREAGLRGLTRLCLGFKVFRVTDVPSLVLGKPFRLQGGTSRQALHTS